jgi:hypothetical protein
MGIFGKLEGNWEPRSNRGGWQSGSRGGPCPPLHPTVRKRAKKQDAWHTLMGADAQGWRLNGEG